MGYSEADLAGLTQDEVEALQGEEATDDGGEKVVEPSTPVDTEPKEPVAPAEAPAEEGAEPPVASPDTVEAEGKQAKEPEPIPEFVPQLQVGEGEGVSERLAAVEQALKDMKQARKEGKIESEAYDEQRETLLNERATLQIADAQAKWAAQQNESLKAQRWQWEQERFFSQASAEMYKDPLVLAALNAAVAQLAGDEANVRRPANWFLEEADRQVRSRFGMGETKTTEPAAPTVTVKPAPPPAPRTIGAIPSAAPAPVGDDILDKIGALEGEDLERYFARLSPADVEKLSRMAS